MESNKLKLMAGIDNLGQEIEIYEWLARTAPQYGTKPFNKRFETWLNKQSVEHFGTYTVEGWGYNSESKDFENVRFSFGKKSWSDGYELYFYYRGQKVIYDYDSKAPKMYESNEKDGIVSVDSVTDVADWSGKIAQNRRLERAKAQSNLADIEALTDIRASLKKQVEAYNDKISYIVSDELRIR